MVSKRVGFVGYDDVQALDIIGPMEAFDAARIDAAQGNGREGGRPEGGASLPGTNATARTSASTRGYEVVLLAPSLKPIRSEAGVALTPQRTLRAAGELDTIVIPGGRGLRDPAICAPITAWLEANAGRVRRVVSVCTGIYALAPTGLLDGRRATTHWRFAADVAARFPRVRLDPDALFLKDGPFYTSGGITAGIDLALALIEEDYGPRVALTVARDMVMYLKRPGGQRQFSEPLRFQSSASDRFADLSAWMTGHLDENLSVETLAARMNLSPRHFSRLFVESFGHTPAAAVQDLKLDEARRRLTLAGATVDAVADSLGFGSSDAFIRAFRRRIGVTPGEYRQRFSAPKREGRGRRRGRTKR